MPRDDNTSLNLARSLAASTAKSIFDPVFATYLDSGDALASSRATFSLPTRKSIGLEGDGEGAVLFLSVEYCSKSRRERASRISLWQFPRLDAEARAQPRSRRAQCMGAEVSQHPEYLIIAH